MTLSSLKTVFIAIITANLIFTSLLISLGKDRLAVKLAFLQAVLVAVAAYVQ